MIADANDIRVLNCPSCGGGIELRASGYSTYFVCYYCGSELDLRSTEIKLIAEHAEAAEALHLPLGTRGTLKGVEWVAIGNLKKSDGWERWDEFLLFNPYHGYRWLVFTKDGWSFGTPILTQPEAHIGGTCKFEGVMMKQCYYFSISKVESALGEFYWRARRGDETRSASYVGGGRILSVEDAGNEYNWTLEEWVDSSIIAEAFGVADTGQYPQIGNTPLPHQPNPYKNKTANWALVATAAFLAGILLNLILSFAGSSLEAKYDARTTDTNRIVTIGRFTIDGRPRPFTIFTNGNPGNNNWMDVEYTLTNIATGEEIVANQPIEYYFGPDWKEDNRSASIKISGVPAGTYELVGQVALPEDEARPGLPGANSAWDSATRPIAIKATSNGTFFSSIFLLFFFLFAPVVFLGLQSLSFEGARTEGYDGQDD